MPQAGYHARGSLFNQFTMSKLAKKAPPSTVPPAGNYARGPMFLQEVVATSRLHARTSMNFEGICCLVDEIPLVTNNSPPTNPNTRQVNKPSPQTATTPRKMLLFAEAKRTSRQASCQTQHMIVICAFRRGEMRVVDFSCVSSRRKRLFARGGARKKGPQGQLLSINNV